MLKNRLASLPEAFGYSDQELTAFEALWDGFEHWQVREKFEKLHPRSSQTREALLAMQGGWAVFDQRDSLRRLVADLEMHGEVDCPNCQHHFFLENDRIEGPRS